MWVFRGCLTVGRVYPLQAWLPPTELPKRRFVRLLLVQGPTASGDLADTWDVGGEVIVIRKNPSKKAVENDDYDIYNIYLYSKYYLIIEVYFELILMK